MHTPPSVGSRWGARQPTDGVFLLLLRTRACVYSSIVYLEPTAGGYYRSSICQPHVSVIVYSADVQKAARLRP
jgi:hypothetical protein